MKLQIAVSTDISYMWCQLESLPLIWFILALYDGDSNHFCKQGNSLADLWENYTLHMYGKMWSYDGKMRDYDSY